MKTKIIHGFGWLLFAVCVALILIHGYNAFIVSYPPYNINKGHIEVGVIGLLIWYVAQKLIRYKAHKTKERTLGNGY